MQFSICKYETKINNVVSCYLVINLNHQLRQQLSDYTPHASDGSSQAHCSWTADVQRPNTRETPDYSFIRDNFTFSYDNSPVPPRHQLVDFAFFLWVVKQLQNTCIKALRICDEVSARKYLSRSQCKTGLNQKSTHQN